jgi:hypothetical protein
VPQLQTDTNGPAVAVSYPSSWALVDHCVPALVVPRQLFALCNRPLPLQADSHRAFPALASLPLDAILIWCYYQPPDDPLGTGDLGMPDYPTTLPIEYPGGELHPPTDARNWSSDFIWRQLGVSSGDTWITLQVWQGAQAAAADIGTATDIIGSLTLA